MKLFPLFAFLLFFVHVQCQTKDNPIITNYDENWRPITTGKPAYTSNAWKENGKWHKQDFYAEGNKLQMDGWYADRAFTIKDGAFTLFYKNGKTNQTSFYSNNKLEGKQEFFYETGMKQSSFTYNQSIIIDTGFEWYDSGNIKTRWMAGKDGNGKAQTFYTDGKTRTEGIVISGNKSGNWMVYKKDGSKAMILTYEKDSLVNTKCVDAQGNLIGGFCIFERPAVFEGGADAWRKFLENNLQYPNYAQKKSIEGVVKVQFIVSNTGEVSEMAIISSPHESLSKEVLRLMKLSPNWLPAILLNEPVMYRHIQSITFKLE
jgi:TonB family protein